LDKHQNVFEKGNPNVMKLFNELKFSRSLTSFAYTHTQLFYIFKDQEAKCSENNIWSCYETFDAARYVKNVQIPMLCIMAKDDPVIKTSPSNQDMLLKNPNITRLFTEGGNHCEFRDNIMQNNTCINWAEGVVIGFFESIGASEASKVLEDFQAGETGAL